MGHAVKSFITIKFSWPITAISDRINGVPLYSEFLQLSSYRDFCCTEEYFQRQHHSKLELSHIIANAQQLLSITNSNPKENLAFSQSITFCFVFPLLLTRFFKELRKDIVSYFLKGKKKKRLHEKTHKWSRTKI